MVNVSAITLPALLAVLATLSAAAPTPNAGSDIVAAANSIAARNAEPVDYSSDALEAPEAPEETVETVSIEARTNHGSYNHWGYDGHWWYKKDGKWYKDSSKYNKNYDQEYRKKYSTSYYDKEGWKWEKKGGKWYKIQRYEEYSSDYWNNNYKRDITEVEARDVDVDFEPTDFAIEARTNHGSYNHWGYDGHWWYKKDGKWYKDSSKYNRDYDQEYRKKHSTSYYDRDGYKWEKKGGKWYRGQYYEQYSYKYWNNNYKRDVAEVEARDIDFSSEPTDFAIEARAVELEETEDFTLEARTNHQKGECKAYNSKGYRKCWDGKQWYESYDSWYNREHKPYYKNYWQYRWSWKSNSYEKCDYNKSYKDGWAY